MTDFAGVLADLRTRRSALQQELTDLDDAIRSMERLAARTNGTVAILGHVRVQAKPGTIPTMPEAINRFFSSYSKQEPQTTRQVIEGVVAQGIKNRDSLRAHVYNTLDRLSKDKETGRFVHHKDGRWSLREWNVGE